MTSNLLKVAVLHRHGSRGPGASELSVWDADAEMCTSWAPSEIDKLNPIGRDMLIVLGKWYAEKYCPLTKSSAPPLWRCSKSGRGKESGSDFVTGFNMSAPEACKVAGGSVPHHLDEDYFFRPWKMYTTQTKEVKSRISKHPLWIAKAAENEAFLMRVFGQVHCKAPLLQSATSLLWSTTYLVALRDCELYASQPQDALKHIYSSIDGSTCSAPAGLEHVDRRWLSSQVPDEADWAQLNTLACWVWEERFLRSGFEVELGNNLMVDLLEEILLPAVDASGTPSPCMSIYSGHDYTLLTMFGIMEACKHLSSSVGFGSYVLFELWDGEPPADGGEGTSADASNATTAASASSAEGDRRILRLKYNANPFRVGASSASESASEGKVRLSQANEIVLRDYSMAELHQLLAHVKQQQIEKRLIAVVDPGASVVSSAPSPAFDLDNSASPAAASEAAVSKLCSSGIALGALGEDNG